MKSFSTLTAYHEKAIATLELMQKAKNRVAYYKDHLKLFRDRHRAQFVHSTYRHEHEIIAKIIQANKVHIRIKRYYLNLIKRIQ